MAFAHLLAEIFILKTKDHIPFILMKFQPNIPLFGIQGNAYVISRPQTDIFVELLRNWKWNKGEQEGKLLSLTVR